MTAYTWTGAAGDGNYDNASNWSPNGVPGATDTATINTSAAQTITVSQNDTIQALTVGKLDTLAVSTGETLTIGNAATASTTLAVSGTLSLNSTGYNSALVIGSPTVTLNGAGTVLLGNANEGNIILAGAAGDKLANVNDIIAGGGQLGAGSALAFSNAAGGVVDANASNQLVINTGTLAAINGGLFEATAGGGGLVLQTVVNDGLTGRIEASGAEVYLNGATIQGGTLGSTTGFSVQVATPSTLDGTANKVTNAGSLVVDTGETLSVLGTLNNTGVLSLQSTAYSSDVVFGATGTLSSVVTLTGGGSVVLGDADGGNRLYGGNGGDTLINLNNVISGSGNIGIGQLNLINDGTISATGTSNALYIQTTSLLNNGTMKAVGSQGLILESVINNSSTGTIASAGGTVQLAGATIAGGTLTSSLGGSFAVTSQGTLQTLSNLGTVEVNTSATLTLLGTITNTGTIGLNSTAYNSDLIAAGPTVTLTGGGRVILSDSNIGDRIYGAATADVLDNVNNIIEGSGQLGIGQLTLVNGAAGVIDATGLNSQLTIQTGTTIINNGLIETTGAAGLALASTVNDSGGGTILAASSTAYLNGADIQGGLLLSTGTGVFSANGQTMLDGSSQAVTLSGAIEVATGATMTLLGTITNQGTIGLNSTAYNSDLVIGSTLVTLNGGGTVVLSDNNAGDRIYGAVGTNELDNVNNTIEGSGQLGANQLTLLNGAAGVIDATGTNDQLVIQTGSTLTNNGLIESTGPAGLALESIVSNTTGTILAAGSAIYLNAATIQGGLLKSTGTGGVFSANGQTTLDGSAHAVTLAGSLQVATGDTMTVLGTIINSGTIGLNSTAYASDLIIGSPVVTLTGGGTVVLSDNNTGDRIYGASASNELFNVNNTIEGSGQLGAGQLTLVNGSAGVIDATGTNATLVISTGTVVLNEGLIEATGPAGLQIESTINNQGGNAPRGTILAGASSYVYLGGADIRGGLLRSQGSGNTEGLFQLTGTGTLDGSASAVTLAGNLAVTTGSTLSALGTITNQGSLQLWSSSYASDLIVASPTLTLNGGGIVDLVYFGGTDRIYGAAAANVLDNVNNTIEGSGQIGVGQLTLVNAGTISATGTQALVISLGSKGTNTATGQLLGVGTGGLSIQNGTYTNAGLIQADNASSVTFTSDATLTNDSATGVLAGGTYAAVSTGGGATLAINGAALKTLSADLILSGAGSSITFGGTAVEASLAVINVRSELQVLNGRSYTSTLALTNSGTLALGGGTFTDKSLNDRTGSLLSGFGTLAGTLIQTGTLAASGGTLELTGRGDGIYGAVTGTGTLALSGNRFTLTDTSPITVSEIAVINRASLAITNSVSYAGTFSIGGNAAVTGAGTITTSGLFEQSARGYATVANAVTNTGTISTVVGGTLAFSGGLANSGLILDTGGFTDTAALTGGTLHIVAKVSTATIASASGAGNSTLATLSTLGSLNTSGTTLTITGDYINSGAGAGNSYNARAGITGTIDGQGTQLGVVGVNGTTIQDVGGTLTIYVTAGHSASFEIKNTGASGSAALRGALQTTVNGGTINGTNLTGSGVTAGNFGPIAAGGASGIYTIAYKGGAISNEAIHLSSDFANVAGLTIDIVSQAPGSAQPNQIYGSYNPHSTQQEILAVPHHG